MCWVSKYLKRSIADRDIKCWKIIRQYEDNYIRSLYFYMKYLLNKEYSLGRSIYVCQNAASFFNIKYEINQGFHSYFSKPRITILNDELFDVEVNGITVDRLYYTKLEASDYGIRIAECIIPKGSVYYVNDSHEVVSDKIIIKDVLEKLQ